MQEYKQTLTFGKTNKDAKISMYNCKYAHY